MASLPVLIYNPHAGKATSRATLPAQDVPAINPPFMGQPGDALDIFRACLQQELGGPVHEYTAETLEETTEAARQAVADGADLVLAAGGDGTLRAVADALIGTEAVLGVLPRGTVNVFARELKIPLDAPEQAAKIALYGKTARLDVGRIGTHHFLLMCSVGIDALAVADVNRDLKSIVGSGAYVVSGLTNLATYTPARFTLTTSEFEPEVYKAFSVVVANAASYAGDFQIAPEADLEDGMLDVCVFLAPASPNGAVLDLTPLQNVAALLTQVASFVRGQIDADPNIRIFRTRQVTLETDAPLAAQVDGDPFGTTPLTVEVVPHALRVRVPPALHV